MTLFDPTCMFSEKRLYKTVKKSARCDVPDRRMYLCSDAAYFIVLFMKFNVKIYYPMYVSYSVVFIAHSSLSNKLSIKLF